MLIIKDLMIAKTQGMIIIIGPQYNIHHYIKLMKKKMTINVK